jgi:hypothetical protein
MERMFIILFILTTSFSLFTSLKSKELRMSISGRSNGIDNNEYIETFDDQKNENSKDQMYTIDRTCLRIDYLIFKGNYRNVTLKIHCGSDGKLLSKTKIYINREYKFLMSSIIQENCNMINKINYTITVENSKGELIYRCNITGGDCEV